MKTLENQLPMEDLAVVSILRVRPLDPISDCHDIVLKLTPLYFRHHLP